MAPFNQILSGRFNRFTQKLFSMKGPASLVTLSDELFMVLPFFNGVENRVAEGWQRYAQTLNLAAGGAGNFSKYRLRNANKSLCAVIEKVVLSNTGAAASLFVVAAAGAITTDLGTLASMANSQLDLRGQAVPNLIGSFENNTATNLAGVAVFQNQLAPNVTYDVIYFEDQEIVLANGNVGGAALHIQNGASNAPLNMCVVWRERVLEDSEQVF